MQPNRQKTQKRKSRLLRALDREIEGAQEEEDDDDDEEEEEEMEEHAREEAFIAVMRAVVLPPTVKKICDTAVLEGNKDGLARAATGERFVQPSGETRGKSLKKDSIALANSVMQFQSREQRLRRRRLNTRYAKFRDAPEQDEDVHFEIKRQLEMDELKAQTGKKGKGLKGKLAGMMKKKTPKKTKTKDPSDDPLYCTLCKKQFKDVDKFQEHKFKKAHVKAETKQMVVSKYMSFPAFLVDHKIYADMAFSLDHMSDNEEHDDRGERGDDESTYLEWFQSKETKKKLKKEKAQLGPIFNLIVWVIFIICMGSGLYFTLVYSLQFDMAQHQMENAREAQSAFLSSMNETYTVRYQANEWNNTNWTTTSIGNLRNLTWGLGSEQELPTRLIAVVPVEMALIYYKSKGIPFAIPNVSHANDSVAHNNASFVEIDLGLPPINGSNSTAYASQTNRWLVTNGISIMQNIFVVQPIKIAGKAVAKSLLC